MIVTKLHGGLGNQMFQYALGRSLASRHRTQLKLDIGDYTKNQRPAEMKDFPRSFKLANFKIEAEIASEADIARTRDRWRRGSVKSLASRAARRIFPHLTFGYYLNMAMQYDTRWQTLPDGTYIEGYWQSEQYFKDVSDSIRREFEFKDPIVAAYGKDYVAARRTEGCSVVAVHVRRGDLAFSTEQLKSKAFTHGPPVSAEYVHEAMKHFDPKSLFLVFSDSAKDLDWCRQNIHAPRIDFAAGHNDLQDFSVMQACDHFILSNSTFSWWAAWLCRSANKRVVAPRNWFYPEIAPPEAIHDLIPADWTLV